MTMQKLVSVTVVMLALTTLGFAQGASTGDLRVTVKDAKGAIVRGATVTAADTGKGVSRAATTNADGVEFFEKKIRPLLADNCYKCHSHQSEKIKGGLLLDTREGLLKGGDSGPAVIPGKPDDSLLIKAVRYTDKELQMPPKDRKLPAEQIADLEAWVNMGVPGPRTDKATPRPRTISYFTPRSSRNI